MDVKKEIKINFYEQFQCIADKCSLTCCQEWRIAVDDGTFQRWEKNTPELCSHVVRREECSVIALDEEKKCPFLNDKKLCKLVLKYGDSILSKTCTDFPRLENAFADHIERTMSAGCPAVVDLLNSVENIKWNTENVFENGLGKIRESLLEIMRKEEFSISIRLMISFYLLLELQDAQDTEQSLLWHGEDEELHKIAETIQNMEFDFLNTFYEQNELYLDMIENYRKQGIYTKYLEQTGALAEKLCDEMEEERIYPAVFAFQQEFSHYEQLFQKYLLAEIHASLWMPGAEYTDFVAAFEWIAMEYVVIRHQIFLQWMQNGKGVLSYETVRDGITVLARVTGFDAEDVYEYMENSFEEVVWDWGYLALIVGKDI